MATDPLTRQTVDELLLDDELFGSDADSIVEKAKTAAPGLDRDDKVTLSPRKRKLDADGVNVDDEVKISKKKRKQIAKLDAERLLSAPGLPRIRELIRSTQLKKKLRLKGKGHEFSDAARILNYYQLWLDNLYPRAKFADALQLVEKAGHSKRMHIMRKEWIDQTRPGYQEFPVSTREDQAANQHDVPEGTAHESANHRPANVDEDIPEDADALFFASTEEPQSHVHDAPDDDELDALMAEHDARKQINTKPTSTADQFGDEDDLDALLAEQDSRTQAKSISARQNQQDTSITQEVDDDLEALLNDDSQGRDDALPTPKVQSAKAKEPMDEHDDEVDDADDLDALLNAEFEARERSEPILPVGPSSRGQTTTSLGLVQHQATPGSEEVPELDNTISSDPIPNVATDDLDQLMDEHDASVKKAEELAEHFMSSSPVPNEDSQ